METLFAYALLMSEGYDVWDQYSEKLDRLFLDDPQNDTYLYLEEVTDRKEAVLRILSEMDNISFDIESFGRELMRLLSDIYKESNLKDFADHMYSLFNKLPDEIRDIKPFYTLSSADDCILYNSEKHNRKLFESVLYYYE
ncbi:MAG: hypothetical protein J1E40_07045 [Oscillospiraceae bacterium]|nr:hypothetical protein [Oscillospiraceae bacterium]